MRYIYPPRPKSKIRPEQLAAKEREGLWLWQRKFDGDRCVVGIDGRNIFLGNRHGKWHNSSKFPHLRREILTLNLPTGSHYLDGEMLAGRILVLFDVLQVSNYLIGVGQLDRLSLLDAICRSPANRCDAKVALQVTDHIWMAEHGFSGFSEEFKRFSPTKPGLMAGSLTNGLIEGLLLRKKQATLDHWGSSAYDVDWQLRCRHGKKNYRY